MTASQHFELSVATMPETPRQRRLAFTVVAATLIGFALLAPFATIQLARVDGFVTAILTIVFLTHLATALLLFCQFAVTRSRALLVLAGGYLFSALIVVSHALTFPGAFTPGGLLGAGAQSSAWLYVFWHTAFPLAVIGYVWLKDRNDTAASLSAAGWTVVIVLGLASALTWAATGGEALMPRLLDTEIGFAPLAHRITALTAGLCTVAAMLLWARRSSVLDLWVMVAVCAAIAELVVVSAFVPGRFTLAYYCGRALSVLVASAVLGMLIAEMIRFYAILSRAGGNLQREREAKRMSVEAALASISHEVRQPLTAIAAKGGAARRLLARMPPDVGKTQELLGEIVAASFRASDALGSVRTLLATADLERRAIDANELALEVLRLARGELKDTGIAARTQLAAELPPLIGHSGHLQEALLSLIQNGIDAMALMSGRRRVLSISTERHGRDSIAICVEDSGPGIDLGKMPRIFDPFVTTRSSRMGLGLAVCKAIVERHGGAISADSGVEGTRFRIVLPIGQTA
jgi:signal transduction histidine kinase